MLTTFLSPESFQRKDHSGWKKPNGLKYYLSTPHPVSMFLSSRAVITFAPTVSFPTAVAGKGAAR